jgi:hypothetical protein
MRTNRWSPTMGLVPAEIEVLGYAGWLGEKDLPLSLEGQLV